MNRETCIICYSQLNEIFLLDNFPIKLSCTDNPVINYSKLSFSQCVNCKTIQLDKLIELSILYSDSHNYTSIGKIWENYFKLFIDKLKPIIIDKNILEIGCPSGKIAMNLDNYNKWFIVEPNKNNSIIFNKNIHFIESLFDTNFSIDTEIDIIIHSHLFEHIYLPNEFLEKCYEILKDDGEMIFGIPNMEYFTEAIATPFLGIFFEHTVFLNKQNVSYLLNNNNFEILEIIDYEKHSTIYHCRKKNKSNIIVNTKITDYYNNFMYSIDVYNTFVNKCNNIIKNTNKDVFIFGASYNTQCLLALGIDNTKIKGILDNCKEKQNKYLYGYKIIVYGPEVLFDNTDCIVILKNGYYIDEIKEQLLSINKNMTIIM